MDPGAVGAPHSKQRGPEQRRHCRAPREVMLSSFPFPDVLVGSRAHQWGHDGVAVLEHNQIPFGFPQALAPKVRKERRVNVA